MVTRRVGEFLTVSVLPSLVFLVKYSLLMLSSTVLTHLTFYQFSRYFSPRDPLELPIHFVLDRIPDDWKSNNLRSEQLLQGNFSLLRPKTYEHRLYLSTEYLVTLHLELADYEANYAEGMFLICMKFFSSQGDQSWPIVNKWTPEIASQKYGKCRSAILLRKSFFHQFHPSNLLWSSTRSLSVELDEHFEQDANNRSLKGMLTILSRNLQVVKSKINFTPATTFASRNPFLVSLISWGGLFFFWFSLLIMMQLYD